MVLGGGMGGNGGGLWGVGNLRCFVRYGLDAQPASLVRGSSRRITIMRFRPANIRVINRRISPRVRPVFFLKRLKFKKLKLKVSRGM